jgi:signal transduction histidine kinase/Na+/proline symporter
MWAPLVAAALYLGALAALTEVVERRPRLAALASHPAVYGLALGVYASTWSFYGSVGFAARHGYAFLAVHFGVALSALAIPFLWRPLADLVRRLRLQSVADLLAYRYQSQAVGAFVAGFLVLALLPYLSLQLRAIVVTGAQLAPGAPPWLGLVYVGMLSLFAALVGARWADVPGPASPRRAGLLVTLAVESSIKCVVLLVIGGVALFQVFGGPAGLGTWLDGHPEALAEMFAPVREAPWTAMCFAAFLAVFLLPRQFHVAFVERPTARGLRHAMWTLPALLLALNLPLPILFWAGRAGAVGSAPPDLWVAEFAARHGLGLVIFLGGISAASAMILISSLALSQMVVHHLVLPAVEQRWALPRIRLLRRAVIVGLVLAGLAVHLLSRPRTLVDLGLVSFAAIAQLAPGVFAALLWPRATRRGLVVGLLGGVGVWATVTFLPLLDPALAEAIHPSLARSATAEGFPLALWLSLLVNAGLFAAVSLSAPPRPEEIEAAAACAQQPPPGGRIPALVDVDELRGRLAEALDPRTVDAVLERALAELELDRDERRPLHLRRLAEAVERVLAEQLGPLTASALLAGPLGGAQTRLAAELRFLEERGAAQVSSGIERALELVRSYLSRVLNELPLAVCSIDQGGEIVIWNRALRELTGIDTEAALGGRLADLPAPWDRLLSERFAAAGQDEARIPVAGGPRILRLTCTALAPPAPEADADTTGELGAVVVVEDLTERRALLAELSHRDRLSSIGRLAAGVAHELLNPLTGMVMVAKNLLRDAEDDGPQATAASLELSDRLGALLREGGRIQGIVRTLLDFSRTGNASAEAAPQVEAVAVAELAKDAIDLARLARGREVELRAEVPPQLLLRTDGPRVTQILVNLLTNAVDASPEGAAVILRAAATESGEAVLLEVLDEGAGIDPQLADRVFEPFFTTKDPGEGTGLGLAISHRLAAALGGSLRWRRRAPRGTAFSLRLPRAGADTLEAVSSSRARAPQGEDRS